jgi:hypothetical protein
VEKIYVHKLPQRFQARRFKPEYDSTELVAGRLRGRVDGWSALNIEAED